MQCRLRLLPLTIAIGARSLWRPAAPEGVLSGGGCGQPTSVTWIDLDGPAGPGPWLNGRGGVGLRRQLGIVVVPAMAVEGVVVPGSGGAPVERDNIVALMTRYDVDDSQSHENGVCPKCRCASCSSVRQYISRAPSSVVTGGNGVCGCGSPLWRCRRSVRHLPRSHLRLVVFSDESLVSVLDP